MQISDDILKLLPSDLNQILSRCKLFIQQRVKRAKAEGVIIGLSGGIDSSTVAAICALALGHEKVIALLMPEKTSNLKDQEHGQMVANQFKIPYEIIDITEIITQVTNAHPHWNRLNPQVVGNVKARIRMVVQYTAANSKNYLVVGSSNKSELLTGYYTKFGDGGADILPLGDLYKTEVRQLADYLNLPQEVIEKPPSAGLWPGQTDENELGIQYHVLDKIFWGLEHWMAPEEVASQLKISLDTVLRVNKMIYNTEHKRRGPFVLKIGFKHLLRTGEFRYNLD